MNRSHPQQHWVGVEPVVDEQAVPDEPRVERLAPASHLHAAMPVGQMSVIAIPISRSAQAQMRF
jgi:hypothetical protein